MVIGQIYYLIFIVGLILVVLSISYYLRPSRFLGYYRNPNIGIRLSFILNSLLLLNIKKSVIEKEFDVLFDMSNIRNLKNKELNLILDKIITKFSGSLWLINTK